MDSSAFKKQIVRSAWGLAIALSVGTLLYIVLAPEIQKVETATIRFGPLEEVIRVEGFMRAKDRFTVTASADGEMRRVALRAGELVKKGDIITEIIWDRSSYVRSPIDGVVSKVIRETAGPIRRGDSIIEIVDAKRLEAVTELLTPDAVRVEIGNPVRIDGWGKATSINGRIARISRAGFTKSSALGVEEERTEVVADIDSVLSENIDRLGDKFHIEMTIVLHQSEKELLMPIGAMFRDGKEWAVFRIENKIAVKTIVKIGRRGVENVAVESGLRAGDVIVLYPGDLIKDGTHVSEKN